MCYIKNLVKIGKSLQELLPSYTSIHYLIPFMLYLVDIIRSRTVAYLKNILLLKAPALLTVVFQITLYFFITALLSKLAVSSINLPTSSIARPWMS